MTLQFTDLKYNIHHRVLSWGPAVDLIMSLSVNNAFSCVRFGIGLHVQPIG